MNFKDFTAEELIGKPVLIINRYTSRLSTIEKVNKVSFKIKGDTDLFSLHNGWLRGSDKWNITRAELITEERAAKLRSEWKKQRLTKEAIETIQAAIKELPLDILTQMVALMPKQPAHETNTNTK
jgi:hypothetical protein